MIKKLLIANRSDTAIRIIKACKELGIATVAIHSSADDDCLHTKFADESVRIGAGPSSQSYLHMQTILAAAYVTKADAIHPGIGFLSENDDFAQMVRDHNLTFVGPDPKTIRDFASKINARRLMTEHGLTVVPGTIEPINNIDEARSIAQEIGYPFMFKGAWCGGGKGIRLVQNAQELESMFALAAHEAEKCSNKLDIYIEKYIPNARHIEFQVVCDNYGNAIHLGERDCSLQRNHQKVWEEAPSLVLTPEQRMATGEKLCKIMSAIGYKGVGTIEFLYDASTKQMYFMEMNTRLQVEHTITEEITGIDLVHLQLRIASGEKLGITQDDVRFTGHSIECRILAEDPKTFTPSPGKITNYLAPFGAGIRLESGIYPGYTIPMYYDNLLAKLIVHAPTRRLAIERARYALRTYFIEGIKTNIPLHHALCDASAVQTGDFNTSWLSEFAKTY